jgi:hypothetical protein
MIASKETGYIIIGSKQSNHAVGVNDATLL